MFPQKSKIGPAIATVVALIYLWNNPVGAAELVNQAFHKASQAASALHIGSSGSSGPSR